MSRVHHYRYFDEINRRRCRDVERLASATVLASPNDISRRAGIKSPGGFEGNVAHVEPFTLLPAFLIPLPRRIHVRIIRNSPNLFCITQ